jgi:PAS domain S-box-containing protein
MLDRMDEHAGPDSPLTRRAAAGAGVSATADGNAAAGPAPAELLHIARLAARLARAPIGLVTGERLHQAWSEPALNLAPQQIDRLHELCRDLDGTPAEAVIPDATQDPRLWHNANVSGPPNVRFVACVPLIGARGEILGTLCVMDPKPRARLADEHADALADLAALAARMLERQADAEAQLRSSRGTARSEQIEAAVIRAQTCELALANLLMSLCKHHRATAGFVGKLATSSRVMQEVCHYNDESGLGDYFARSASLPATPETSHAAGAIQTGTARALVFSGTEEQSAYPAMAEAIRAGLRAEVIQPVHLLDEKFGLVLMFDSARPDLDAIAEDVGAMVRLVRPALYRKAAERRMRLLGTALDRANDAVLITEAGPLGASGPKIVYANASFCRESGYALDEVIGQTHGMLHGPNTDAAAVARLRQEMRRWKPTRAELLNVRKDGSEFWAEMDLTPITDEAGLPTHWISIQRDVTQRRDNEAAQRRHEASFRMLFQDNPLPMVVMKRDSLAFIEVNDAAIAQYGWSRAEFLTKTLTDLNPDGDRAAAQALAAGRPAGPAPRGATSTTHMRDDGTVLEVRAFVHDTVYAGQDATLAVLWDVTDLEAARRDMHHANEMLRERTMQLHARTEELGEAQRLARLGTWRMSFDRQEVSWSKEMYELMGLPRDHAGLSSESLIQRIHPDDRDTVRNALAMAAHDRVSRNFEYRVMLPDDQIRHLRAEVRPVLDENGAVAELFGYSQDISDRKRAEAALLRNESLRALGQLTGGVAHDFNNLLTVVILNLEEAQDVLDPAHELQEVLQPALHAAVRGAELTSQLLSYARRATLRPERVRPDEFFGALRPLLNRVLGERYELQVLLRHNGGSAMVDPAQLDSAIMNLVINARDASPQGGAITLETRSVTLSADSPGFQDEVTPGRYVVISVSDRGEGIPAHLLPRVFEPFFTTKEVGKGSGMGLSMVYGFARQSGGHVTIESVQGRGTTVRLFLPIAAGSTNDAEDEAPVSEEWNAHGLRALVVEDQDSVLKTVTRMLRQLGFKVTAFASADAALLHLEQESDFDLLFTDIVLPGEIDGVGLAEEVRARSPNTRILLTSGFTEHSLAASDMIASDVDFLMKPYKRQDLQAKFTSMFPRAHAGAL